MTVRITLMLDMFCLMAYSYLLPLQHASYPHAPVQHNRVRAREDTSACRYGTADSSLFLILLMCQTCVRS